MHRAGVWLLLAVIGGLPAVRADEPVPTWELGSWYQVQQTLSVAFGSEQGTANLLVLAPASRWSYVREEMRQLTHGSGSLHLCHVVAIEGDLSGGGSLALAFPRALEFPVEIRGGNVSGEACVRVEDLALVSRSTRIMGELWGQPFGPSWVHLGSVLADVLEEYDPPLDPFGFPIALGREWDQSLTHYLSGRAGANVSFLGKEVDLGGRLEESLALDLGWRTAGLETVAGCPSYHAAAEPAGADGAVESWYCPAALWLVKLDRRELPVGETGARVSAETLLVTDYAIGPPTPTPTAIPSGIGVDLVLAAGHFSPGDTCFLDAYCYNDGPSRAGVPLFVVLDVYGQLFFSPTWAVYPPDIDFQPVAIPTGGQLFSIIPVFTWPETGSDAAAGLAFYGAMLNETLDALWGEMDVETFSFGPALSR